MAGNAVTKLKHLEAEARIALDDSRMARQEEAKTSRLQRFLHFWATVYRSFVRNRCPMRASSLAYASLLAMVPMLAVVISVSAGLLKTQGEDAIMKFIDSLVERMTPAAVVSRSGPAVSPTTRGDSSAPVAPSNGTEMRAPVARSLLDPEEYAKRREELAMQIKEFIGNIRSGSLGVTGVVVLISMAISMLSRIEDTFNDIWGVARGRTWFARIVYYWAAMTLGPLLLAVTLGLTSGPYFESTKRFIAALGIGGAIAVKAGIIVLPYVIWSLAFALFYQLMPNTKVRWNAAVVGGLVGGCLWQLNSEFSVLYVSRVVTNSKIYGSLGMIPVFMVGIYAAWVILLLGAQVAYAFQNRRAYLQEKHSESVNQRSREFVALRLMTAITGRFKRGDAPPTVTTLAETVGVPTRLASQLLTALVEARLLEEVGHGETAYVPARPPNYITVHHVLQALRAGRGLDIATRPDDTRDLVRSEFERIAAAECSVADSITIDAIAASVHPVSTQTTPSPDASDSSERTCSRAGPRI